MAKKNVLYVCVSPVDTAPRAGLDAVPHVESGIAVSKKCP